jgi:hypothetical protein
MREKILFLLEKGFRKTSRNLLFNNLPGVSKVKDISHLLLIKDEQVDSVSINKCYCEVWRTGISFGEDTTSIIGDLKYLNMSVTGLFTLK